MQSVKRTTLNVEIEARSPLALGDRKPTGRSAEAVSFISGGLLRGALAEKILKRYRHQTGADHQRECRDDDDHPLPCDFCDLFLRAGPSAIFRNAYPATSRRNHSFRLPATAQTCKDKKGFIESGGDGVFDTLVDRLCSEQLRVTIPFAPRCMRCGGRLDAFSAFYTKPSSRDGAAHFVRENIPQRLLTRVAINRRRLTAEDQLLYSMSVLSENRNPGVESLPARFVATVDLPAHLAEDMAKLMENIKHLGGGQSRGLGRVEVTARLDRTDAAVAMSERIVKFNTFLTERWRLFAQLPNEATSQPRAPGEWAYFTLDLQADAILKDETDWQPAMVLSNAGLQREAGCNETVELVQSEANYTYRSGWNAALGQLKDVDVATAAASVFVYRTPRASLDRWMDALADLERHGIGARRAEGFGQIKVCDEFHLVQPGQNLWEEKQS